MSDRELLELAARAAGIKINQVTGDGIIWHEVPSIFEQGATALAIWDPLTDDGDALRLAVKLNIDLLVINDRLIKAVRPGVYTRKDFSVYNHPDKYAAARLAIVECAAEIGKQMHPIDSEGLM